MLRADVWPAASSSSPRTARSSAGATTRRSGSTTSSSRGATPCCAARTPPGYSRTSGRATARSSTALASKRVRDHLDGRGALRRSRHRSLLVEFHAPALEPALAPVPGVGATPRGRAERDLPARDHGRPHRPRARQRSRRRRPPRVAPSRRAPRGRRSGAEITDLGSHNGTFVNGRLSAAPCSSELDVIGIGHHQFRYVDGALEEYVDTGEITSRRSTSPFAARRPHVLLDDVGFALDRNLFLAVVGPSGSGKSTLLDALTGFKPADEGRCSTTGATSTPSTRSSGNASASCPRTTSSTPSSPCGAALEYAAELRFPPDVSRARARGTGRRGARRARVDRPRRRGDRAALRRAAQAGQRRARAADPAVAAPPRRADLGPRPRLRAEPHGAACARSPTADAP